MKGENYEDNSSNKERILDRNSIPFVSANAFWFVVIGNVLLWLGVALKGF